MEAMELESNEEERSNSCNWLKAKWGKIESGVAHIGKTTTKVAKDDPRRIFHSIKVGLAITIVSLFYYFDPLYEGLGVNAMWAVLTVVVVFEFSVGATLGKGLNRILATMIGGMVGVGAHRLSSLFTEELEPALLGISVFILAAVTTFIRFFPKIKAKYDYGLIIFILTFSLICVSGYRDDEVLDMAERRITTILIGSFTAVAICVVICPVWAGSDLHSLVASHIDKLGDFLLDPKDEKTTSLEEIKSILSSESNLNTLLTYAWWEPRHGRFKYRHPWEHYKKIGELTRHCARSAEAVYYCLHSQSTQVLPNKDVIREKLGDPSIKMGVEAGKALKELSKAMATMTQPSKAKPYIQNAKQAALDLNLSIRSSTLWNDNNNLLLSDVTSVAALTYLLVGIVNYTEEIAEVVQELASLVNFNNNESSGLSLPPRLPISMDSSTQQQVAE